MTSQPQVTCWFTDEKALHTCANPGGGAVVDLALPVATDGRTKWAACQRCGKVLDVVTVMERVKP